MINAEFIYQNLDSLTKHEVRMTALSPHFKLFLQAVISDCNNQLTNLSVKDAEKLVADYHRIVTTRDVYEDLLELLTKITTEEGENNEKA